MKISAIIATRGDVPMEPVIESLPEEWEVLLWDNGSGRLSRWGTPQGDVSIMVIPDLSVYGRYAAIEFASHEVIYVQDDDCIVRRPEAIVEEWVTHCPGYTIGWHSSGSNHPYMGVVCNMPSEFRHDFYVEHGLVGFGAVFHRDAPELAFNRFWDAGSDGNFLSKEALRAGDWFQRTCDIVFTALTPRVFVNVPKDNLPYAYGEDRMWRQPEHQGERVAMLELALKAKEAHRA